MNRLNYILYNHFISDIISISSIIYLSTCESTVIKYISSTPIYGEPLDSDPHTGYYYSNVDADASIINMDFNNNGFFKL